ncbi:hypothetical protein, partial [Plasmodium yoelii yoelii]
LQIKRRGENVCVKHILLYIKNNINIFLYLIY